MEQGYATLALAIHTVVPSTRAVPLTDTLKVAIIVLPHVFVYKTLADLLLITPTHACPNPTGALYHFAIRVIVTVAV